MQTMIDAVRLRARLAWRERQRVARVRAFSRRTPSTMAHVAVEALADAERDGALSLDRPEIEERISASARRATFGLGSPAGRPRRPGEEGG